jgi:peptide/nickel transport system substrate-binding protein
MLAASPFVIMAQEVEVVASRKSVSGMTWGPSYDDNRYATGRKE